VIPVYQGERLILGAVLSALRQTHRALEVWVVDDGSTDGTVEQLAVIDDPRLRILRQPNGGTARARNAALARAQGRYIAFLDSDDRWFPEKIAIELAILQRTPKLVGIAYSSHYAVDDRGKLLHIGPIRRHAGSAFELLLDGEDFLMPCLCLFDRRIFDAIGMFDTTRYHEDHDFILRATRQFPIYPTGRRLVVYRQTTSGKCRRIMDDFEAARDEELGLVSGLGGLLSPDETRRLRRNVVRSLYLRFLMYGLENHARRLLQEVHLDAMCCDSKGKLGWLFARTGVNLLAPARLMVQTLYRVTRQGWWRRYLVECGLELRCE
jgi:glycosyltransferase involved in cell wall biosynthesis